MILILDNYDSFVHNLARYVVELGEVAAVHRNDAISVADVRAMQPSHLILSPGPCTPAEAGISVEAVRELGRQLPILGVCLGHQAIAVAYGGAIARAKQPMHGKAADVIHDGTGVLAGLPTPFSAGRYHSLVAEPEALPDALTVNAWSDQGEIMGFRHREFPVHGVQFHPESILTEHGHQIVRNFLEVRPFSRPG